VLGSAISHDRRTALTTVADVNLGLLVGVVAAAGVSLLTASRLAFDVVRLVGA
jgi:threonine/homoserine/homoserine lactone efflux protein